VTRHAAPASSGWFVAWAVVGAGLALALLTILSIGIFVLAITTAATVLLATRPKASIGLPGLISGLSLPLFYVAYLNRGGPGTACTAVPGGESCSQRWSPYPWVGIGVVLFLAGLTLFVVVLGAARRRAARPEPSLA
jgi:hypothetical protein